MSISNSKIINRILGFSLASWVNCVITLLATPIVTTFFVPAELGKINLFIAYANVFVPFVYMGFDQAFARFFYEPSKHNDSFSIGKLCISLSTVFFVILSVAIIIFWKIISLKIVGVYDKKIAFCMVGFVFATYIMRYTQLDARMKNKVVLYSIQAIIATVITKVSYVIVALYEANAENAIILFSFSYVIISIFFLGLFLKKGTGSHIYIDKEEIISISKYAIPIFPSVFLLMLNSSLSQLLLEKYLDYSAIGIFSNALTIAGGITVIQAGLNLFWTPFVFEYYKTEKQKLQKLQHAISFAMIGFAFIIILLQYPIYLILVNKQFWDSKTLIALLLITPVCGTISETLGIGIDIAKKTYLRIPVFVINIVINWLACIILIPLYGVLGAAVANAGSAIVMMASKAAIGNKYYQCCDNYLKLAGGLFLLACAAIANFMIVGLTKYIIIAALFAVCIFVYRNETSIIISLIKNTFRN